MAVSRFIPFQARERNCQSLFHWGVEIAGFNTACRRSPVFPPGAEGSAGERWLHRGGRRRRWVGSSQTGREVSSGHRDSRFLDAPAKRLGCRQGDPPDLTALRMILLTAHREEQYVLEAISAGIKGYVLKSEAPDAIGEAIEEVTRGNAYLSPSIARFAVDSYIGKCVGGVPAEVLSPRELQVLQLIADGNTTREIAAQLKLTVKTAESYRTALMGKLDIHETASLVRYAVRRGLIKP